MPKTRQQKEEIVGKLKEKLSKASSVVFADYKGLTMSQMSDIRNQISDISSEFIVTKNNLLKLALKNSDFEAPRSDDPIFEGPIATLFSYDDEISPIKILSKAFKDNQIGSFKAGVLNGEFMDAYSINRLAQLPGKDELRAKIVGSLGAPLYGVVNVLQANLRNLVYALEQVRKSKGGE